MNNSLLYKALLIITVTALFSCAKERERFFPDYLCVRLKTNPTTLDPALIVDVDGARIAAKLYNGLVAFDKNLLPVSDIAESWTISEDGLNYRFKLKEEVRFFNGRRVIASDFKYSFKRVLDPATRSPRTWVLSRIKGAKEYMAGTAEHVSGISIISDNEIEIRLDEPFAPFLSFLGLTTAYVVPREEVAKWGADFSFHGSGTGPFVLDTWNHNQFIAFRANNKYFGEGPKLSGIYYKIVPEDFTAMVEFEKGGIDVLPEIIFSEYKRYADDPKWKEQIETAPGLNTYYLGFNCEKKPFNDPRVRKALSYAIDREKMLSSIMDSRGVPAAGPIPPILRKFPVREKYSYDPVKAKKLLKEAGYPDGFSMKIYQTADIENLNLCQVVQSYLKDINIRADIVQLEWSSFLEAVTKGEAQSFWLSWWADYPDAENFLFPTFHSTNRGQGGNRSRFSNNRVDDLLFQAVKVLDDKKRSEMYKQIEEIIIDQAPWIFFWHKSSVAVCQPWVKEYFVAPIPVMEKWNELRTSH